MPDYHAIYESKAVRYHALVSAEDTDGNLSPALSARLPAPGARVVEVGCGTGRLTRMLLDAGMCVTATEGAAAMLDEARDQLGGPSDTLSLAVADARALPFGDDTFDAGVAGWVFGHFTGWMPETWEAEVDRAVGELERVVRPGGDLVILETLGTGTDAAGPPHERLAAYYARLEAAGFAHAVLETDYQFDSPEHAATVCGFFFGDALVARIRARGWARVPEWTGIWHRRV